MIDKITPLNPKCYNLYAIEKELLFLELEEFSPLELAAGFFHVRGRHAGFFANLGHAGLAVAKLEQLELLLGDHPERDRHGGDCPRLFGNDARPCFRALQGDVLDEFGAPQLELLVKIERHAMRGIAMDVGIFHREPHRVVQEGERHFDPQIFPADLAEDGDDLHFT